MKSFIIFVGVDGTGKSSIRGVISDFKDLGHIVDADLIAKKNNYDIIKAGKKAIAEINHCFAQNITFTQETTLSGKRIVRELEQAKAQGYFISMFYIGIDSADESLMRIANRVRKGGHNIPTDDVVRRYEKRIDDLAKCVPYCNEIIFYDNQNGFTRVAEYSTEHGFSFVNGYKPQWLLEVKEKVSFDLQC